MPNLPISSTLLSLLYLLIMICVYLHVISFTLPLLSAYHSVCISVFSTVYIKFYFYYSLLACNYSHFCPHSSYYISQAIYGIISYIASSDHCH